MGSRYVFLGVHISEDLTWSLNSSTMVKKAQQRLYFLRSLKKAHLCPRILVDFYRCTIESILTNCISVWYGSCSASDRKALQRVVKTAQRITGTQLPTIESVYQKRCLSRARSIIKDPSHPNHELFTLLPSGRRYRSLRSRTNRLRKSFFPEAVTLLNSTPLFFHGHHTTEQIVDRFQYCSDTDMVLFHSKVHKYPMSVDTEQDCYDDCPYHHVDIGKDYSGVTPDCHGVTQNANRSCSVTKPAFVLEEMSIETFCGGTMVSAKMNDLLSCVTHPEGLVSLHLQPYCKISRSSVRIFMLHGERHYFCRGGGGVTTGLLDKLFNLPLTTVPPHMESLVVFTKAKVRLITEDDMLPF
ncbi:hypothetical protein NFI96_001849 [Prochilodus magdalenae]|nr:hypothetical protein NFI96_001849 [Prochilodus magdalenae]